MIRFRGVLLYLSLQCGPGFNNMYLFLTLVKLIHIVYIELYQLNENIIYFFHILIILIWPFLVHEFFNVQQQTYIYSGSIKTPVYSIKSEALFTID